VTGAWRSGPLSVPAFRLLTAGQFTSTLGDYCYAVALPWLVLSAHGSAAALGIILACYGIPRAALTTLGGSLADRIGPRTVMLCSDGARCALTTMFAVFAAGHVTSVAALAPVAAVLGGCSALFLPASLAIMPSLLAAERLPTANAVYNTALQAGALLGPVLGGAVVAVTGPAVGLGIDAASYAVSAASLALIPAGRSATAALGAGLEPGQSAPPEGAWKPLLRERILQIVLLMTVMVNFADVATTGVALPALSHARFGVAGYGAVLACFGAGSVAGTLAAARFGRLPRPALVAGGAFLAAAAAIAVTPFGGLPGAAAAMLVFGLVVGFGNVVFITLIQQWAPPAMLGRVMGLVMLAAVGSFPLSATVAGVLTTHLGPPPVFVISGALIAAAAMAGLVQREFRDFGARSHTPDGPAPERSPAQFQ
jgi:MFS family permease